MKLLIEEGRNTPRVSLDSSESILEITGRCFPEDSSKFFTQLYSEVETFSEDKPEAIHLELFYINSSSAIALVEFFRFLAKRNKTGTLNIVWRYETDDDESRKLGESFMELLGYNIRLVPFIQGK